MPRPGLHLTWNINTVELKSTYNTSLLLFSTQRKLFVFEASIVRNEKQEMISYLFFVSESPIISSYNRGPYMFMYTGCTRYRWKNTGCRPGSKFFIFLKSGPGLMPKKTVCPQLPIHQQGHEGRGHGRGTLLGKIAWKCVQS